jgi:4-amino-4-deoxy-L-arabinose transferase-like glycosyltransferase
VTERTGLLAGWESVCSGLARREALWLAVLTVLPLLPFLGKAVSIDAPVFVAVANRIVESPADPFGFQMIWDSSSPNAHEFNRNPPLVSYYLAGWIALFGERDWLLHAVMLPFPLIASLSFLGIARRVATQGLAPAALLVVTPAFLVLATTLLLDVPLLACLLFAVYALLRGAEEGGADWQWAAGGAVAAAGLVKYVGLSAAPLLAAGVLLLVSRPAPALLRVLVPPALAWGLWGAYTASLYGSVHFLGSTDVVVDRSFEPEEFWNQVVSTPVYYGCALVFPMALWLASLLRGRRGTELAVISILLGTAGVYWALSDGEPPRRNPIELEETIFAALGFAGAFFLCVSCLRPSRWLSSPTDRFLALWLAGFLVFTMFLNWHVNAADALLVAPPLILLLFRSEDLRPSRGWTAAGVAFMLLLSMGLAWSDAIQANFYRTAAERMAAEIGGRAGDRWFVGQWGFQHYLERQGFRAVVPPMYGRSDLAKDDWVASARNVSQLDVSHNMNRYGLREVWSWESHHWLPLRTTNPDACAGFYSNHYGYVPFAWSRLPFEKLQLGRVVQVRGG